MATKQQVIELHLKHPEWTAREIANHLGCLVEYVGVCKQRYGLQFPKSVRRCDDLNSTWELGREARRAGLTIEVIRKVGREMRIAQ